MGPFLRVNGKWDIVQSNGFRVTVTIDQTNDQLSAAAVSSTGVSSTSATGSVNGPDFSLLIHWEGGAIGLYTATWSHGWFTEPPLGYLQGTTVDQTHPTSRATWVSDGRTFQIQ